MGEQDTNDERAIGEDFIYPEQFTEWELQETELLLVRFPQNRELILGHLNTFISWCNEFVPYIKNLSYYREEDRYFVTGVITDDDGESIYKDEIMKLKEKFDDDLDREVDIFGYLDITEVRYAYTTPVEVRVVNTMERMGSFWGIFTKSLREIFLLDWLEPEKWKINRNLPLHLDKQEITRKISDQQRPINIIRGKPGRPTDSGYDSAYRRISIGMDNGEVFTKFCEEAGIKFPDKNVKDSFRAAMKRRQK